MKKYFVSYLVIGAYFTSVFLISLLIALLVSLVDVPRGDDCNTSVTTAKVNKIANENNNINNEPVNEKQKMGMGRKTREINNKFVKTKLSGKKQRANDECPEFLINQNGTLWEDVRLPSYIRPTRYDIEIALPTLVSETYAGVVSIRIELDQDTKYILFHSTSVEFIDGALFDKSNKEISINCGGYYELNGYYVIITDNIIPKSASPLKLNIKFEGLLFQTEQGIFDIPYQGGQSRYNSFILNFLK